ncbi:Ribonuclease J [Fusobacterium necrophorum subsp. funduliforme]|uniref:ribonuclease J n=1 Tax=Fusobacterium necrophorum TaxID=859 RepID=UPI00370E13CE
MNKLEDGKGGFDNIRKALKNIKNEIDELKSPKKKKQVNLKKEMKINEKKAEKKETKKTGSKSLPSKKEDKMFVIPLGGLEEVGKNMTVLQYKYEIIVVDVGAIFPDESLPGVDLVIPDFTFLENNKEKIKGVFITHAHEDHIGAIPYLYEKIGKDIPIYGGKLTMAFVKSKFDNVGLSKKLPKMKVVTGRTKVKVGKYFSVEFVKVTHSITDSYSVSIKSPAGHVFHTGDFKIDLTPVDGDGVDFARLAELGDEGVDLLLSDSTNSEVEGFTPSEKSVGEAFKQEFMRAKGRIIIAVFASHIHRIQQIIDIAVRNHRKIAIDGRSLVKVFEIAPTVGCLNIPEGVLVSLAEVDKLKDNKVVILCTGTQGEPMAALSRIAKNMHKHIKVKEGDTVIISATPIPGNEKAASSNINNLLRFDAEVVFKKIAGIHVSGHGSKEEQKLMLNLIKPKHFMPVHGELRMLKAHMKTAMETGVAKNNILITQNGNKVEVTKNYAKINGKVTAGETLVDGLGIGDIGSAVIKDRQQLSQDGIVVVAYTIERKTGKIIAGPEIATRGFVYMKDAEELMKEASDLLEEKIPFSEKYLPKEWGLLKNNVKDCAAKFFYNKTKRNPMILPIITEL